MKSIDLAISTHCPQFLSLPKGSNSETRSQEYRVFVAKFILQKELEQILKKTSGIKSKITAVNYRIKEI